MSETSHQVRKSTMNLSHIYVLSAQADRVEYMRPLLDNLNLEYEIFQGPNFQDIELKDEVEQVEQWSRTTTERVIPFDSKDLPGRLGCALGHRRIWQDIVNNEYASALVLEDDVDVNIAIQDTIEQALIELPSDWKMLYPGFCSYYWTDTGNQTAPDDGRSWHQLSRTACSHAYIIKYESATWLLNRTEFFDPGMRIVAWDVHMAHMIEEKRLSPVYGFSPRLATQRPRSVKNPSLVSATEAVKEGSQPVLDQVERGWRFRESFSKQQSAAYQAGVSYWHDL